MNCDDVVLLLGDEPRSPEVTAHLSTCAECTESARVLSLAVLPALTPTERMMLPGIEVSVRKSLRQRREPTGSFRRVASLALAAGLGALVASAVIFQLKPAPVPRVETVLMVPSEEVSVLEASDELNLSDDEVFFDVGWPSPTEGDL